MSEQRLTGANSIRIAALLRRQHERPKEKASRYKDLPMWRALSERYRDHWRRYVKLDKEARIAAARLEALLYGEATIKDRRLAKAALARLKGALE